LDVFVYVNNELGDDITGIEDIIVKLFPNVLFIDPLLKSLDIHIHFLEHKLTIYGLIKTLFTDVLALEFNLNPNKLKLVDDELIEKLYNVLVNVYLLVILLYVITKLIKFKFK
jgi:hypothetical protein